MIDRITVLMPTYGHSRFIKGSVQSVLSQSFRNYNLHVLVDSPTDESIPILRAMAAADSRILVTVNERNMKRGWCRQKLLEEATTDVVAWMDSDDEMLPGRLEKQVAYMNQHPEVRFLGTEMVLLHPSGVTSPGWHPASDLEKLTSWEVLNSLNPIANPTMMFYRRDALGLGGYSEDHNGDEDKDLWIRLYKSGGRVHCFPEPLLLYRLGTSS